MQKAFCILLFLCILFNAYSQDYDLIVTTKGDSIACNIDSITATQIYLTMIVRDAWVNTYINNEEVKDYKYNALDKKNIYFEPGTSIIHSRIQATGIQHTNMYMFSPSVFGLEKGDYYWSTYYLLIHDMQYGITDRFTIRIGTDIVFGPFYFLPTYTITSNDKSAFAVGDLLLIAGTEFAGNLLYGMYTRGNVQNNVTIGAGYWTSNISEFAPSNNSLAINLSAKFKISDYTSFITENYGFNLYTDHWTTKINLGTEETYARKDKIIFGLSGIRLISKKNIRRSWQFGLLYVFCFNGHAPDKYDSSEWDIHGSGNIEFYPIPIIGYSIKFGKKYK